MEDTTNKTLSDFDIDHTKGVLFTLKSNLEDEDEVLKFKYIEKKQITHDSFIYTYEIPDDQILGIWIGGHIAIVFINN